jgi:hypothetical protein
MFILEVELAEDGLVDVELEEAEGVDDPLDELDERFELLDELPLDELELLDRSSCRESSLERPRQSRDRSPRSLPWSRSLLRSLPRSPYIRRKRSRRSSRLSPSERELRPESWAQAC